MQMLSNNKRANKHLAATRRRAPFSGGESKHPSSATKHPQSSIPSHTNPASNPQSPILECGARFGQTAANCHKAAFILPQATYLRG